MGRTPTRHPHRLRLAIVMAAVALPLAAACVPVNSAPSGEIYGRINQIRAQNGAGPLAPCGSLARAAQAHAGDMAARGSLTHYGGDGSDPGARLRRHGYGAGFWGEVIAGGTHTVEGVVGVWMNSPRHRAILLDRAYRDIGVGVVNGYWVADVGAGGAC